MINSQNQSGAFLLMTVIVVMITALMGIYVMENSMLDVKSTANEQHSIQVFLAANSQLDAQMAFLETNATILNNARTANQSLAIIGNPTNCGTNPGDLCQTVTLRYINETPAPAGYDPSMASYNYELDSLAVLSGSRSSQTVGFIFVAPKASK